MKPITITLLVACLVLTSCGTEPPTGLYAESATVEEREMLDQLAQVFVDLGHPAPTCPVEMCHKGDECMGKIKTCCGLTKVSDGVCEWIIVSAWEHLRGCNDPARTATEEWLHAEGYGETDSMRKEKAKIIEEYRSRWEE